MTIRDSVLGLMGCVLLSASFSAGAALSNAGFKWTGEAGYTVEGMISYDNSIPIVSGFGFGATTGIQQLDVAFYNPSHTLLFSTVDVADGVSSYEFLNVSFDTVILAFTGDFDIGQDGNAGDLYLAGTIGSGSDIFDFDINSVDMIVDGTSITVIPEPASLALFAIGFAGLASRRRKAV